MKINFSCLRFKNLPTTRFTVAAGLAMMVAAALLSTGCGKAKKTDATPAPAPAPENVQAPETNHGPDLARHAEPASATAVVTTSGGPDLGELNRSLMRWLMKNRRQPKNFEDFAASAGVAIPPAPAGKKYIIEEMEIKLVNR